MSIDLYEIMAGVTIIARRHGLPIEHRRRWAVRLKVATWLFHLASIVAGFKYSDEDDGLAGG